MPVVLDVAHYVRDVAMHVSAWGVRDDACMQGYRVYHGAGGCYTAAPWVDPRAARVGFIVHPCSNAGGPVCFFDRAAVRVPLYAACVEVLAMSICVGWVYPVQVLLSCLFGGGSLGSGCVVLVCCS